MGIYVKFTITTHQIWSCHVILASNSEKFYFSPNSVLNFRKVAKFGRNWLKNKSYRQKQIGGRRHSPVLIGLKGKSGQKISQAEMKEHEKMQKMSHHSPQCAKWFSRYRILKSGI